MVRKRADEALRESEKTFRALAENANDGILIAVTEESHVYANRWASEITGYSIAELQKRSIKDLVAPEESKTLKERFRNRLLGKDIPQQYETVVIHKDGKRVPVELSAAKTSWHGQPADLVIIRDITERKRIEEALRESYEKCTKVFQSAPSAITVSELDSGRFVEVNEAATTIFGYSREELIGKSALELGIWLKKEDRERFINELKLRGRVEHVEILERRKFGELYTASINADTITIGTTKYLLTIISDITERKRGEEQTRWLASFPELNPSPVIEMDAQGTITFANTATQKILKELDLPENPTLFVPEDKDEILRLLRETNKLEMYREITLNNEIFAENIVLNHELHVARIYVQNITERKRVEEALQFTRHSIDSATDTMVTVAQDGHFVDVNDSFCRISGYSRDELLSMTVHDLDPEYTREIWSAFWNKLKQSGTLTFESTHRTKEGRVYPVEITAAYFGYKGNEYHSALARDITKRKRAEEALRESENWYRTVFENTGTATVVVEENNIISLANAEFAKLSGFSKNDIEGKKCWTEFVVKEDLERMLTQHRLRRQNHEKALTHYEFRFVTKSGDIRNIYLTIDVIPGTKKSVASLQDITERKLAEEALKEAHGLAHIGIWDWVKENDTVTWSEELFNIAGRDPSLPAPTYTEHPRVYTPASWDRLSGAVTRALNTGEPYNLELELVRPDGSIRWINAFGGVKRDGKGKVIGLHGTVQDITERKQTEEEITHMAQQWQSTFDATNDAIWILDKDQRVLRSNKTAERLCHSPRSELIGRHCWEIVHHTAQPIPECPFVQAKKSLHRETMDLRIGERWFEIDVDPIFDEAGEFTGAVHIISDITGRKRSEEALKTFVDDLDRQVIKRTSDLSDVNLKLVTEIGIRVDAEKQLTKILGEKEVLIREVHHRVKNNLQIIISLLNLQSRYIEDEKSSQVIKDSQSRIRAMALVHEKLYKSTDISKIDLGDYIQFLGNSLFQFFGMQGKGITLTMDIRDIFLDIDTAIPLGLIINELISNSLKYAFSDRRKGEISIAIHRQDHTITILFKDNGVGISQDFDWRNPKSLGLRLVISLVEQLSGTIELDRTTGTTFTIVVKEKE